MGFGATVYSPLLGVITPYGQPVAIAIQKVLELTGSSSPMEVRDMPVDDPHVRCPDITRAKTILGWQPKIGIEQGLQMTIEYFRKSLS